MSAAPQNTRAPVQRAVVIHPDRGGAGLRTPAERLEEAVGLAVALDLEVVSAEVARPRGPRSLSTHLKSRLGIQGVKMALLHEVLTPGQLHDPKQLAQALKALPIPLVRPRPVAEAISTAGGVPFEALDANAMLRALPGVFCAGEMLDWEAPTGGYLLTACLATGRWAGQGVLQWLDGSRGAGGG